MRGRKKLTKSFTRVRSQGDDLLVTRAETAHLFENWSLALNEAELDLAADLLPGLPPVTRYGPQSLLADGVRVRLHRALL